jgi:hypothetical protein
MEKEGVKSWWCDANKKVSYRQRGAVEVKKANVARKFYSAGQSFVFFKDEVIESALFDKVTRDCHGEAIRKVPVRRFRKVGSDEWYAVPANIGNANWENTFTQASDSEIVSQAEANRAEAGQDDIDADATVQEEILTINKTKESEQMGVSKAEQKKANTQRLMVGFALLGAAFVAYRLLKKK